MVPKTSFPPVHHHPRLTKPLKPVDAQKQLAAFLAQTSTKAYLHPDAILSASGIQYSAQSGPNGGLALHHLRRMEAGLRGENLIAESAEELAEQFGALPDGDDTRVDALIDSKTSGNKRQRSMDEVGQWAEDASEAAYGDVSRAGAMEDWEDKEQFELKQQPIEGEIGDRDAGPAVQQNGEVPAVVSEKKVLSELDKKARKAAKKEKNKARKAAVENETGAAAVEQGGDAYDDDDEPKRERVKVDKAKELVPAGSLQAPIVIESELAAAQPGAISNVTRHTGNVEKLSKRQKKRSSKAKREADELRQAEEADLRTHEAAEATVVDLTRTSENSASSEVKRNAKQPLQQEATEEPGTPFAGPNGSVVQATIGSMQAPASMPRDPTTSSEETEAADNTSSESDKENITKTSESQKKLDKKAATKAHIKARKSKQDEAKWKALFHRPDLADASQSQLRAWRKAILAAQETPKKAGSKKAKTSPKTLSDEHDLPRLQDVEAALRYYEVLKGEWKKPPTQKQLRKAVELSEARDEYEVQRKRRKREREERWKAKGLSKKGKPKKGGSRGAQGEGVVVP